MEAMKKAKVISTLITLVLLSANLNGQETITLKGRIISEELEPLPKATINNMDTTLLGTTDLDGYFSIQVPSSTDELLLGFIGMEWTSVRVIKKCDSLEMIVISAIIYDFISPEKIKRKRIKRFKQLPDKHAQAYEQGLFSSPKPCINYVFRE